MASSTEMAHSGITMSLTSEYDYDYPINSTDENPIYTLPDAELLPMSNIYIPVLYIIMFLTGSLGNLFVIVVIGKRRKKSGRLVDTFVLNLALADLVFVLTLPMWAISTRYDEWPFGEVLCKISSFIIAVNRFSNIFFLTCMSVDRYLAVVRLMDSRFLRSSNCAQITCGIVWVVSFFLGSPSLAYRHLINNSVCSEDSKSSFVQGMNLLTILLTFLLPVLILGLCYGSILVNLRRHCHNPANTRTDARRRHSVKIVFAIISAFLISWLPFNCFKAIHVALLIINGDLNEDTYVVIHRGLMLSCCLAFLNSCVNPAIYFFLDQHFRRRASMLCLSCLSQNDQAHQSYITSNSYSNGTSETCSGNTSTRGRLFSLTQKA
ncbi:probable G-protein coupled receptor 25 [Danio rerio]|uniref:Probable G-protein coupled receptor 25 n=2 Tax=Danio rerio TaxID=7955 RepID=A0A2S1XYZ5_DANRE|nr:probable G-protein coupled receptor 25 [Danio rerio]XP_021335669.1 probable G-protein coupled receptor 25 [Danio rerio]AWJ96932.1 G-protein coupled receptor 25 [Danio rerio]|eukprot:XP_001335309.4 probable G-protein coupled receptor 25 [Danio rerio]